MPEQTAIAFDFGTARIGTAVGQTITGTASPLRLLTRPDGAIPWEAIARLVNEWQPDLLVVGLPLHADGTENPWVVRTRRFANQLHGRFNLPVELVDERHTSIEAATLAAGGSGRDAIDNVAACLILERWLNRQNDPD